MMDGMLGTQSEGRNELDGVLGRGPAHMMVGQENELMRK